MEKGVITPEEAATLRNEDGIPNVSGGYDRGLYLKIGDRFFTRFNVRLQFRYTFDEMMAPEDKTTDTSTFQIKKARLLWSGTAWEPWIEYGIQLAFDGPFNSADLLKDFYVNLKFRPEFQLQAGQYKVWFNRSQIQSTATMEFVERSIAAIAFNANTLNNRDVGITLHGDSSHQFFQYYAGVFNGNGPNTLNNRNEMLYVGRAVLNPMGPLPPTEGDIERSPRPLVSIGVGYAYDAGSTNLNKPAASPPVDYGRVNLGTLGVEGAFKWNGLALQGEYFYRGQQLRDPSKLLGEAHGYYAQAGYFILPKMIELAGRYSRINPDTAKTGAVQSEAMGACNVYFHGHEDKLQLDYSYVVAENSSGATRENRIRAQYQIYF